MRCSGDKHYRKFVDMTVADLPRLRPIIERSDYGSRLVVRCVEVASNGKSASKDFDDASALLDHYAGKDAGLKVEVEVIVRNPRPAGSCGNQREQPTYRDENDQNVLQWGGYRGGEDFEDYGETVAPFQHCPMFFRGNGAPVELVNLYKGRAAFLCLNGPGLPGCHPSGNLEELIRDLHLPGVMAMSVNQGGHVLRPHLWTCVDGPEKFLESIWQDPQIQKFVPMHAFTKPIWDSARQRLSRRLVRDYPNVVGYRRNEKFTPETWCVDPTINWGNHTKRGGTRSVMLVALRILLLLGFSRVYLLGADFKMKEDKGYFFAEDRSKGAVNGNNSSYKRMAQWFKQLQPEFKRIGFEVFNATPGSGLKAFPESTFEEGLNRMCVQTDLETRGMYEREPNA